MSKITVTYINCLKAGLQYIYKTILYNSMNLVYLPNISARIPNWFTSGGWNLFNLGYTSKVDFHSNSKKL